jgi:hypothetical protein
LAAIDKTRTVDTSPARKQMMRNAADRAVDDPAQLAQAARIVRAALARQRLTLADVQGEVVRPSDLVAGGRAAS